jgi:glucokinase
MSEVLLGIDVGGTKVAAGLVNSSGEIVFKTRNPMNPRGDAQGGLLAVQTAIDAGLAEAKGKVSAIGIISPGPLDPKAGVILNPPNIPCWRDYPLVENLNRSYSLPIFLDNDANAAGLAEAVWGAARGFDYVFYATLGTGVGTGIILNQRIFHGRTGNAAEAGHTTIDYNGPRFCQCGKPGCIEGLVSGTGIARRARLKATEAGEAAAPLLRLAGGDMNNVTGEIVGRAWREGDPLATQILEETADLLAIWFGNMVDVLDPEVIVIGGGVSELIEPWIERIARTMPAWTINPKAKEISIRLAKYRADAGIAGAAALSVQTAAAMAG